MKMAGHGEEDKFHLTNSPIILFRRLMNFLNCSIEIDVRHFFV